MTENGDLNLRFGRPSRQPAESPGIPWWKSTSSRTCSVGLPAETRRAKARLRIIMRNFTLLLLTAGLALHGQPPVGRLLQTLRETVKPDQAVRDVRTIWDTDRWFTFPKFEETAKNVAAIMKRAGLEDIEIGNPPADGVTQGGYWTMPLAWDVKVGTLELLDPQVPAERRVLADYQKVPASIGMWSGPTPPGGVTTEVVLAPANLQDADLKGKLVLGGRGSKTALAAAGAL